MSKQYELDTSVFERRQQLDDFINELKKHRFPSSLKFAYIGAAAYTYLEQVRSKGYGLNDVEIQLVQTKFVSVISNSIGDAGLNVIDIGTGNGTKASIILDLLLQKISNIKYIALDYSEEMSLMAVQNIHKRFPQVSSARYPVDFEVCDFRGILKQIQEETGYANLLLFLGHTLGNAFDRLGVLSNLQKSMGPRDGLLVGVELYQPETIDEVLAYYHSELFFQAIFQPLTLIGLQKKDGVLRLFFNDVGRNVEVRFQFAKDIEVRIGPTEMLKFKKGEEFLIFNSHRFSEEELEELLSSVDLSIVEKLINDRRTYKIVLARINGQED